MMTKTVFDCFTVFAAWVEDSSKFPDEHKAIGHLKDFCHHRLCFNKNIAAEYQKYFHRQGYPSTAFQLAIEALRSAGKVSWVQSIPRYPVKGLGRHHKVLVESAVAGKAKYIVTKYPEWDKNSDQWRKLYGVRVLTPSAYCQTQ